jgi:hypothetical protein
VGCTNRGALTHLQQLLAALPSILPEGQQSQSAALLARASAATLDLPAAAAAFAGAASMAASKGDKAERAAAAALPHETQQPGRAPMVPRPVHIPHNDWESAGSIVVTTRAAAAPPGDAEACASAASASTSAIRGAGSEAMHVSREACMTPTTAAATAAMAEADAALHGSNAAAVSAVVAAIVQQRQGGPRAPPAAGAQQQLMLAVEAQSSAADSGSPGSPMPQGNGRASPAAALAVAAALGRPSSPFDSPGKLRQAVTAAAAAAAASAASSRSGSPAQGPPRIASSSLQASIEGLLGPSKTEASVKHILSPRSSPSPRSAKPSTSPRVSQMVQLWEDEVLPRPCSPALKGSGSGGGVRVGRNRRKLRREAAQQRNGGGSSRRSSLGVPDPTLRSTMIAPATAGGPDSPGSPCREVSFGRSPAGVDVVQSAAAAALAILRPADPRPSGLVARTGDESASASPSALAGTRMAIQVATAAHNSCSAQSSPGSVTHLPLPPFGLQ